MCVRFRDVSTLIGRSLLGRMIHQSGSNYCFHIARDMTKAYRSVTVSFCQLIYSLQTSTELIRHKR